MEYGISGQENQILHNFSLSVNIEGWLIYSIAAVAIAVLILIARKFILFLALNSKYHDHAIYLLRVPKEKPNEKETQNNQNHLQYLREEIARGETIFKAIGGLKAQSWHKNFSWLLGRNDHFSFEIVANHKFISFYVVAPRAMGRYIEQQIQAYYPEAVLEEVEDYNIFSARGKTEAGFIRTKRSLIFPLKTYNKMEADPLNSLVNAMSKLGDDESIAIQYVVRSARKSWHNKVNKVVSAVNQGKKLSDALRVNAFSKILMFLGDLADSAKPEAGNAKKIEKENRLTAMEQEVLKLIEEKNSKAGLDVNIRIVASAKDKPRAKIFLNNIISAFSQYNYYQYGNILSNKMPFYNKYSQKFLINDFIYRRFKPGIGFILNTEELASLYHPPLSGTETPNILWLSAKYSAAPSNIPDEGIALGKNIYRGIATEIKMKREDRRRHTYIIGKSGVGKSVLLASMAIQDIINGEGVCVIDPHGDLISDIMSRIPRERADDVILFAPADMERPLALNLLEFDARYPEQKTFVINEMIKIFDKLYDLKATGGPIFEQYMRNAMLLVMSDPESGSTLMEIPKVLADAEFRKMKLEKCKDPTVVDFWRKEAEKAGGEAALANVVPYITSKLTSFISNDTMRPIIAQQKSSFNLRDVMNSKKILLVDLSKGLIGEMNAHLLGMILVGKILMSALSRTDMPPEKRVDFYLYIDEFQNFTTDSINSILSEARKYNLNLTIAHQYLGQLVKNQDTSIKNAVFGNVGTWVLFKIGSEDAETMVKEFAPVFNQYDLINIEKYTAYVKLLIDNTASRPFSMSTVWPLPGIKDEGSAAKIKSLSRMKYGQDRNIIEAEIRQLAEKEKK
ncbi:MAG: type IV secretory system conjugative DNA transfer family protein [bacterium]